MAPPSGGGRRKALFIGINYFGSQNALKGCINDVTNVKQWLLSANPAYQQNMLTLTDDQQDPRMKPTKANIIAGMKWLAMDARPGDHLFFHYSGHGAKQKAAHGEELEDQTLVPLDFQTAGQIIDNDIHGIMLRPLPQGVILTAFVDCCHSGTVFDLPYTYAPSGNLDIVEHDNQAELMKQGINVITKLMSGDKFGALTAGFQAFQAFSSGGTDNQKVEEVKRRDTTRATVLQFSGCMDTQTSADAHIGGQATGALSWALLQVLRTNRNPTLTELLQQTRGLLQGKYQQIPQMSTGYQMNVGQIRFEV